jgi:hypothetical protein
MKTLLEKTLINDVFLNFLQTIIQTNRTSKKNNWKVTSIYILK